MRNFKKFPSAIDFDNLLEIQKEFLILLAAYSPSMDAMEINVRYLIDKNKIDQKDFVKEIQQSEDMLSALAGAKGVTLEEYRKIRAEDIQEKALKELEEKYNIGKAFGE